jgi:benzoyl-CoA reductase/2-hydroxyglutaryl-CoA dehydratase subunit BcrC/BadD/HgdB
MPDSQLARTISSIPAPAPETVLGWTCSYTPEELILAAGLTPCRLQTEASAAETEAHLAPNLCPYVHRLLAAGMSGARAATRGTVFVYSCDPMRRLADIWSSRIRPSFMYRLDVPRKRSEAAVEYFTAQLSGLKRALEAETGESVSRDQLTRSIRSVNETRRIMRRLADLRSRRPGLVPGSLLHRAAAAAVTSPREDFNRALRPLLEQFEEKPDPLEGSPGGARARILLCGCPVEDAELLGIIEQAGADVVADDLCTSMRHFDLDVSLHGDPLRSIARRYLDRADCPRMQGAESRTGRILRLAQDNACHGVVFHSLKFCDLAQSDLPGLQAALGRTRTPVLHLERQNLGADSGQIQTRIEAFTEMLKRERTRTRHANTTQTA